MGYPIKPRLVMNALIGLSITIILSMPFSLPPTSNFFLSNLRRVLFIVDEPPLLHNHSSSLTLYLQTRAQTVITHGQHNSTTTHLSILEALPTCQIPCMNKSSKQQNFAQGFCKEVNTQVALQGIVSYKFPSKSIAAQIQSNSDSSSNRKQGLFIISKVHSLHQSVYLQIKIKHLQFIIEIDLLSIKLDSVRI